MNNPYQPQNNGQLFPDIQQPAPLEAVPPVTYPPVPPVVYPPAQPVAPYQAPVQQPAPVVHPASINQELQEQTYTLTQSQLEKLIDQTTARVQVQMNQPSISDRIIPEAPKLENAHNTNENDLSELMWSDPEAFAQKIEQKAIEKIQRQQHQQNQIEQFWNTFYQQNPDLNRAQDHALAEHLLNQEYGFNG